MIKEIRAILEGWLDRLEDVLLDRFRQIVREELAAQKANQETPAPTEPVPSPIPAPIPSPIIPSPVELPSDGSWNPFEGLSRADLHLQTGVVAKWVVANPGDPSAKLLHDKIAVMPTGVWLTGGTQAQVYQQVTDTLKAAAGKLVTFVVYNIPARDNGGQSAGGSEDAEAYYAWCGAIDAAINDAGNPKVVLIMEPDALGFAQQKHAYEQYATIKIGIDILTQQPNRALYLDVSMWNKPSVDAMVEAIQFLQAQDKMENVRGWALNTSGYNSDAECHAFGEALCAKVGGHYIVDTSRNGNGPAPVGQWENVPGMKLGPAPLSQPAAGAFDGNLWIKPPGESDGSDNGAPNAGEFYYERAVELAR